MKPLNPMFQNKEKVHPKPEVQNVRKKTITKSEGRRERCDKKRDVKIPFNEKERRLIKYLSRKRGMLPSPYCTYLMKKALNSNHNYFETPYDPKGKPYPAKLEKYYHEKLFEYTVEWDCSLKESAYRIITFMLIKEMRELNYHE